MGPAKTCRSSKTLQSELGAQELLEAEVGHC